LWYKIPVVRNERKKGVAKIKMKKSETVEKEEIVKDG